MIALAILGGALAVMLYVWGIFALSDVVQGLLLFGPGDVAVPVIITILGLLLPFALLAQANAR